MGICRLNHDYLWRLLYYCNLGSSLQIAGGLRLVAQGLDGPHDVGLLVMVVLTKLRRPREVLGHVGEYGRKQGERFNTWIPGLLVNRRGECAAGKRFILL